MFLNLKKKKSMLKRRHRLMKLAMKYREQQLKPFFAIPEKYRCNPYEISPSGDWFFADKRNVENFKNKIAIAYQQIAEGKVRELKDISDIDKLLDLQ